MTIRILIADDEPNQLELLSFNLVQAGFEVMTAADGQQALQMAREEHPDLVILDWMMPHLSGMDVCRNLRGQEETKWLPIIMLSARGEEGDRTLGLDSGADDYLTKPFSPRELVSRVKALLRRASPALMNEVLFWQDITLNPATMEVQRDGHFVPLGPKEFKILSILMQRPGQVYSRAQLLDMVWGHGVYVEERTVDVHLSRLRKALNGTVSGKTKNKTVLRTVRGSGYALARPEPA